MLWMAGHFMGGEIEII